jgi:hypothetical protein
VPEVVRVPQEAKLVATFSVHPPLKVTRAWAAVPLGVTDQDNVTVAHESIERIEFRPAVALHTIEIVLAERVPETKTPALVATVGALIVIFPFTVSEPVTLNHWGDVRLFANAAIVTPATV